MRPQDRYTYADAGFNGFLSRSMKSNPNANNVTSGISVGSGKPVNFDMTQIFGSMGNKLKIGRVMLNGIDGRVEISDENDVNTSWFGNLI